MPRPRWSRTAASARRLGHLGVGDEVVAVEDADRLPGDVEVPMPVADDVGLLDDDLADVLELGGGHELVDAVGVRRAERTDREAVEPEVVDVGPASVPPSVDDEVDDEGG